MTKVTIPPPDPANARQVVAERPLKRLRPVATLPQVTVAGSDAPAGTEAVEKSEQSGARVGSADSVPRASDEAIAAARHIDNSSGRRDATPVRKVFVRAQSADENTEDTEGATSGSPPLIRLYRGGRSGVVAIKLFLALLWRNSSHPFDSDYTYSGWATLLDLEDPEGKGTRRIADAVRSLVDLGLVKVERPPGQPPRITLLAEDGRGGSYTLPGASYSNAVKNHRSEKIKSRHRYFRLNSRLWTTGRIQALPGPALVMLLIILTEWSTESREVWFSGKIFQERYGLSAPTRAAGIKVLRERRLIRVEHRALGQWPGATVFDPKRERQVYTLRGLALPPGIDPPPGIRAATTAGTTTGKQRLARKPVKSSPPIRKRIVPTPGSRKVAKPRQD